MNQSTKTNISPDRTPPPPEEEVRTDLWSTMSIVQLNKQRDLLLAKNSKLIDLMSAGGHSSTVQGLYTVIQQALKDITALIDSRASQQK